jgi:hypothetical protein
MHLGQEEQKLAYCQQRGRSGEAVWLTIAARFCPSVLAGDILLRVNYAVSRQKKDVEKYGKVYQIAAPAFTLTKKFYFRDTQRAWALARHQHQHQSSAAAAAAAAAAVNNGNLVLPWGQSPMSSATNPQLLLQQQQEPFQQQQPQQTQPAEDEQQQHQRSQQQPRQ